MTDSRPAASNSSKQAQQLKELIARGKEQGYLTYAEVNDHLPSGIVDPEQIEDIVNMINDMGILVYDKPPDPDSLLLKEETTPDEEDTEAAARAGEFETYLYIHGEDQLLHYLKRTWSGLWTERAIHNRAVLGGEVNQTGGGVIVQRMVNSRVSGVLQTVNIPRGNLREMVINAGLGLGEGVVSGTVAADQVTVSKETDSEKEALRFSYITSDKTEQIVFNRRAGFGTVCSQTLYHQRLRPALEYVELCQLIRIAASLEKAYGYPLDIEFGIEGSRLWLLQARPVASFLSVLNETIERFPLKMNSGSDRVKI